MCLAVGLGGVGHCRQLAGTLMGPGDRVVGGRLRDLGTTEGGGTSDGRGWHGGDL